MYLMRDVCLSRRQIVSGALPLALFPAASAWATSGAYQPRAEPVADGVYAIIGPLGQRSRENAGLNANYGFIVTGGGVVLIDSGASAHAASLLEQAVRLVTREPVRWVVNTGSQDHRWLGNDHFAAKGATVHALAATAATQRAFAAQQIDGLRRFVGDQMDGTRPRHADVTHASPQAEVVLGGVRLKLIETGAHYPGDAMIHLPDAGVVFTGDLVYVDRLLGVLPQSSVRRGDRAFGQLKALAPKRIVPGHGRVTDLAQAQRETGDYYRFLIDHIGSAARNLEPMAATLDRHASPAAFMHLQNFGELHRANMNRVFLDFEANP